MQSASNCLSAWLAMANPSLVNRQPSTPSPPAQTQALASVSVAEQQQQQQQQQLDDRRTSSMTASTSQAASTPAALSTAATATAASTGTGSTHRQSFRAQSSYSNASPGLDSLHEVVQNGVSQQAPAEDASAGLPAEQVSKQTESTAGVPLAQLLADPLKILGEEPDPIAAQHASSLTTAESLVSDTSPPSASDSSSHDQHTDKVGTTHPTEHANLDSVPHESALSSAAQTNPSHDQSPSSDGSDVDGKKAKLLAFETSFAQAAAAAEAADTKVDVEAGGQLSEEWHALRQGRLTASTFANALG